MKRAVQFVGTLLVIIGLVCWPIRFGALAAGIAEHSLFSGYAILDGPLSLELSVNPPITTPGGTVSVQLLASNKLSTPAGPQITLNLPNSLSFDDVQLPAGTNHNYQTNDLTWLPLLNGGGQEQLNLTFKVTVADLTQPEQIISATLTRDGQSQTISLPVWIGLPAQANLTAEPAVAAIGQPVQLWANPAGTGPFTQNWDFGDGRRITTPNPQVAYGTAGTYQVTLQLANPLGVTTASKTITVVPQPAANFRTDDAKPVPLQAVQFINLSGGQPPLTYAWDFGDGTSSNEVNPIHQFPASGYFPVRLTVTSPAGTTETVQTLVVGNSPSADFMMEAATVTGRATTMQAFHDGTVTEMQWNMGDGKQYSGEEVTHVYHQMGTFNVTMTARNEYGEIVVSKLIQVGAGILETYLPLIFLPVGGTGFATPAGQVTQPAQPTQVAQATLPVIPALTPPQPPPADQIAANPGGAGPTSDNLPDTVQPQIDTRPPETLTITPLPPQAPLSPQATPAESLLWWVNEARRLYGLPMLTYSYELSIAAQIHAEDMLGVPGTLHIGSDGSRPADRQARYGFTGYYAGEAVAWGWGSPIPVVEFWVNSPPHRVLILNPNTTHLGVGYAANANAENIWYWAAEFGLKLEEPVQPPSPQ